MGIVYNLWNFDVRPRPIDFILRVYFVVSKHNLGTTLFLKNVVLNNGHYDNQIASTWFINKAWKNQYVFACNHHNYDTKWYVLSWWLDCQWVLMSD